MKPIPRSSVVLTAILAWGAPAFAADAPAAAAPATAAAPIMIANLTAAVPNVYGYESWDKKFVLAPGAGFHVLGSKGAQGDGGFCHTLDQPLDLSQCAYIEVAVAVQPNNEVPEYTVALVDADGTLVWARIRVDQLMPGQPVWMRLPVSAFAVSTDPKSRGADGKMDWSKVSQWHLQGDWRTKKPAQIVFIALRARP